MREDSENSAVIVKSFMPHEGASARFRLFPARKNGDVGGERWSDGMDRKRKELETHRKAEIECTFRYCNEQAAIERKNLVKITRLCVRELVDLYSYSPLDDENSIVLNLCVIIEHVLSHRFSEGARWRRGFGGDRRCFWDFINATCSQMPYNSLGVVHALDYPRTAEGKGRAWIRLALMEKRLAEYFITAMQQVRNTMTFYEDGALMLSEDINILTGYLLNLNALEFNFVVKDQYLDFDTTPNVDYSAFLQNPLSNRGSIQPRGQDDGAASKQMEICRYRPESRHHSIDGLQYQDTGLAMMAAPQPICCAGGHVTQPPMTSHIKVDVNINHHNAPESPANGNVVEIPPVKTRVYTFLRQETLYAMAWIESSVFAIFCRIINGKKMMTQ